MMVNGITTFVVAHPDSDIFDTQREIQVCVGYCYKGTPIQEMSAAAEDFEHIHPGSRTLPGWQASTEGIREAKDLPRNAVNYLKFISDQLEVEIGMISTSPERDATIVASGTQFASWL